MKKFFALLLALTMALALVACGGNDSSSDAAETTDDAAEKVTLNVIAAQYGTQTADWWVGFESDFEAAYNDIDLVVDVVCWNDIYTVVNTRIANGEAPHILNIDEIAD